jgi:hypothetical protein
MTPRIATFILSIIVNLLQSTLIAWIWACTCFTVSTGPELLSRLRSGREEWNLLSGHLESLCSNTHVRSGNAPLVILVIPYSYHFMIFHSCTTIIIYINWYSMRFIDFGLQHPTELWKKKKNVSIYRRRLSMIEKLRTFFFFHNYCFHNCFSSIILSVTVCPSIRNLNAF